MLIYDARKSLDLLLHHTVVRYLEYTCSLHGSANNSGRENQVSGLKAGAREVGGRVGSCNINNPFSGRSKADE